MLKLHLFARVALALGASVFIAGSASAASTSDSNSEFVDFFESIFDNDSNSSGRAAANLDTGDLHEVIQSVSVLGHPEEGEESQYGDPEWETNNDGRRVTGEGEGELELIDLGSGGCNVSPRRCDMGGGDGGAHPVPEPSAGLLFALGALLVRRRLR
jgi:hypothetical protein